MSRSVSSPGKIGWQGRESGSEGRRGGEKVLSQGLEGECEFLSPSLHLSAGFFFFAGQAKDRF